MPGKYIIERDAREAVPVRVTLQKTTERKRGTRERA